MNWLSNLNSIYNDINFLENENSITIIIFLEIIKLINHPIPKVNHICKKLIKYIGDNIYNDSSEFLKRIELYVNDYTYKLVMEVFITSDENKRNITNNSSGADIASLRIINKMYLDKYSYESELEKDNFQDNFIIYKKVDRFNDSVMNPNIKSSIDENGMDNLNKNKLDNKGRFKTITPVKNYPNYNLNIDNAKKVKNKILKSRLKRYNDFDEKTEEIYDVSIFIS
jgi:hypothetical protein